MFFIVLDLRLTKVGARRCSFFYAIIEQLYLLRSGQACLYNDQTSTFFQLADHPARELFISSDNQLWLSCFDGLYKTTLTGSNSNQILETVCSGNPWTTSFMEDSFGSVWIGTYRDGALCFRKNNTPFVTRLAKKNIESLVEDNNAYRYLYLPVHRNEPTHAEQKNKATNQSND